MQSANSCSQEHKYPSKLDHKLIISCLPQTSRDLRYHVTYSCPYMEIYAPRKPKMKQSRPDDLYVQGCCDIMYLSALSTPIFFIVIKSAGDRAFSHKINTFVHIASLSCLLTLFHATVDIAKCHYCAKFVLKCRASNARC